MEAAAQLARQKEEEERAGYAAAKTAAAMDRYKQGDLAEAKTLLEEALAIHPENEEATARMAEVQMALDSNAARLNQLLASAQSAFSAGRWDEAIQGYQTVLTENPSDARAQAGLQAAREAKLQAQQSEQEKKQLIARLSQQADEAARAGQVERALDLYRQWMRAEPDNRNIQRSIDRLSAEEARRQADFQSRIDSANLRLERRDFDRAVADFESALSVARLAEEKKLAEDSIQRVRKTREDLEKAEAKRAADFQNAMSEADQLLKDGLLEEAREEIAKALQLNPSDRAAQRLSRSIEDALRKQERQRGE
jgi:tetratricopeptide (TPR) repeat protein